MCASGDIQPEPCWCAQCFGNRYFDPCIFSGANPDAHRLESCRSMPYFNPFHANCSPYPSHLRGILSSEIAKDLVRTTTGAGLNVIPWLSRVTPDVIGLRGDSLSQRSCSPSCVFSSFRLLHPLTRLEARPPSCGAMFLELTSEQGTALTVGPAYQKG